MRSASVAARNRSFATFVRYVLFAGIAGVMNLVSQWIVFSIAPVRALEASILAGTAVGFIVKYILDKHWIFFDSYDGVHREVRKIVLYGLFSVAMTVIFWGFEVAFLIVGGTEIAKYTGAVIGLSIGYFAKYLLDRNYTFDRKTRSWS